MTAPATRTDGIDFAAILTKAVARVGAAHRHHHDGHAPDDVVVCAQLAAKVPE